MTSRRALARTVVFLLGALVVGCAGTQGGSAGDELHKRCRFVRIEHSRAESDLAADSVTLTLTVTPSGGDKVEHVQAKVVVQEEDVQNLEARLQQQPHLLCEPEPGGGGYRVVLPE